MFCFNLFVVLYMIPHIGQSREKVHTLSWRVSDFNFFGFIPWIGDSLALKSQKKSSGARFWRFRAKKWPNSTFFGTDFEIFAFSYFFAILTPPRAYMDGNTMLYAWVGTVWLKNAPNCQIWQKCQNHKKGHWRKNGRFIFDFLGLKSPAGMPGRY